MLLLHGYDSKPSALEELADLLGNKAEVVAGFEDVPGGDQAWWLDELTSDARDDLTSYLDEISDETVRAVSESQESVVSQLLAKAANSGSSKDASTQSAAITQCAGVGVVGFSQGGSAALSWLLDPARRSTISTVIAVAGFLPNLVTDQLRQAADALSTSHQQSVRPTIHMIHLSDDEVVDAMVSERASSLLRKAGFSVTDHHVEGTHVWSPVLSKLAVTLLH